MAATTVPSNRTILRLAATLLSFVATPGHAGESVSVRLTDGGKLIADVHPRTNDNHLWLRFGSGRSVILRAVAWDRIAEASIGDEPVDAGTLRQMAAQEIEADESNVPAAPAPDAEPTYADQARALLGFSRRITSVDFEAHIANWDGDVEFDGLVLRLFPLDANGQLTCARGTLNVELVAARRFKFNDAPTARGQIPSRLAQWSVNIAADQVTENGVVVKLPFVHANHPEFDTSWATHGLVHVRFVVPGHGVFEQSFDGLRVRPYAPLRDQLELQGGPRFLPTEQTGVSKRTTARSGP